MARQPQPRPASTTPEHQCRPRGRRTHHNTEVRYSERPPHGALFLPDPPAGTPPHGRILSAIGTPRKQYTPSEHIKRFRHRHTDRAHRGNQQILQPPGSHCPSGNNHRPCRHTVGAGISRSRRPLSAPGKQNLRPHDHICLPRQRRLRKHALPHHPVPYQERRHGTKYSGARFRQPCGHPCGLDHTAPHTS